jgi:hypothetical protein
MAPVHYLRHIGLGVPVEQLALAYYQTYGLSEDFKGKRGRRVNVSGYRFAVREFIPRIAYAVTILHRKHEPADPTTPEAVEIHQQMAAVALENNWQIYRRKAGIGTYTLAGVLFVLPKLGPLKMVDVKGPTESTEAEYVHSVFQSSATLRKMLARFTPPSPHPDPVKPVSKDSEAPAPHLQAVTLAANTGSAQDAPLESHDPRHPLPNRDLDTGRVVQPGGYSLTDSTYARLLHSLTRQPAQPIPPGIKVDIQAYYANPDSPITTKRDRAQWAQVQADLQTLATMPTNPEPTPFPTYDEDAQTQQQ